MSPEPTEPSPAATTPAAERGALPFAERGAEDAPGHWLLASLGKKVLRPAGRELTETMVGALPLAGSDVVELAPGLGQTARLLLDGHPASYVGGEEEPAAAGTARITLNHLRRPDARRRVNAMWRTFHTHRDSIIAVAVVASKPGNPAA